MIKKKAAKRSIKAKNAFKFIHPASSARLAATARIELRDRRIFSLLSSRLSFDSKTLILSKYIAMEGRKKRNALKAEIRQAVIDLTSLKNRKNKTQLTFFYEFLARKTKELEKTNFTFQYSKIKALTDIFAETFNISV